MKNPFRLPVRVRHGLVLPLAAGVCLCANSVNAQYPQRTIRLIVPNVAGGTPDFIARVVEPGLSDALGQRMVVDNRPGAGGLIGTELATKAPADGYTLFIGGTSAFAINPAIQGRNTRFDPLRDFSHIGMIAKSPLILVTHPSLPARNVGELVALARKKPGGLSYASSGNGTSPHMFGEMFKHAAGVDILHVPYKGGPQALTALVSGEVEGLMGQIPPVSPFLKSGRVRGIAVSGTTRSSALPQVPTFEESGLKGLDTVIGYMLSAPAGLPPEIVAKLNRDLNRVLESSTLRARFASEGLEPYLTTPAEAAGFVRAEIPRWAEAVRLSGAKPD